MVLGRKKKGGEDRRVTLAYKILKNIEQEIKPTVNILKVGAKRSVEERV